MAFEVSSVPLSLTIVLGLPRSASSRSSSRAPDAGDRGVGHQRQAFARAVVDHDEDAQAAAIDELIGNEVERPAVIRPLWNCQWRPCAQSPLASAAPADHEALLAIEPKQPLMVHNEALPSQHTWSRR